MKHYKRIHDTWGDGSPMLVGYECKENPDIFIRVDYGWTTGDRVIGYTLTFKGSTEFTENIVSYQTLKEAKEWADHYFK